MLSLGGCFVFGVRFVKFTKQPKRFDEQRTLVRTRGLAGGEDARLEQLFSTTNYYRLSAYWYTFRQIDRTTGERGEQLSPGCTFDLVWDRYTFDRKLRLLAFDAIERIEVVVRTQLAYHHAHEHGPFGYVDDPDALPKLKGFPQQKARAELMERIADETGRAEDEVFVRSFFKKHGDAHGHLPIWMATEIMGFRTLLTIFQNCSKKVKNAISSVFAVAPEILSSWLLTLNTMRNVCAHHGRLWNREIGARPIVPTGTVYKAWNTPVPIKHDRMFASLTVLNYLVERVAPDDHWAAKFRALLDRHPTSPVKYMGFPENWTESPLWAGASIKLDEPPHPVALPEEHPFPTKAY